MPAEQNIFKIEDIEVRANYSARRSISITVNPEKGPVIRVPFRTSVKTIEKILKEKSHWIRKAVENCSSLKRIDTGKIFCNGESVLYMGKEYFLKITSSAKYFVRHSDNFIEVGINGQNDPEIIKALLESWYKSMAKKIFNVIFYELLEKYSKYGFRPTGFTVRTMKKRWGSCSSKGKIAISYDLIRLSSIYSEYVIIHELCHLIHHNHGSGYYRLLSEVFPRWKEVRKDLKQYIR
jgi:predicted metal-dependent hydrolase